MATERKHESNAWQGRSVEDALVALMDRYETPIYNYLLSILRDRDLALECAQETFLRAYDALCNGEAIDGSGLYTVARKRAADRIGHGRHAQRDGGRFQEAVTGKGVAEGALQVQTVVARLPHADREVLYLFEIAGFTTEDIGVILGIRDRAVRQHLLRARQQFRALYRTDPGETTEPEGTDV